ncbi:MAG: HAD-IIIA family hydrolase [Nitrospirae bacterium]|nr:HAD-IIIA family hydrolase [Nitrospirota bacterium]
MRTSDAEHHGAAGSRTDIPDAVLEAAGKIRLLILDVDGVLTDGGIILDNEGNELKSFHVRDGHGIKLLIRKGVGVAIITGRHSRVVERRAHELGVKEIHQRCLNKVTAYEQIKEKFALQDEEIAYIGDDVVDIPILRRVGLPVTVADASEDVRDFAMMVTVNRGGRGAVREITDLILRAKGLWKGIIDDYIKA